MTRTREPECGFGGTDIFEAHLEVDNAGGDETEDLNISVWSLASLIKDPPKFRPFG